METFQPLFQYGNEIGSILLISTLLVFCIPFFLNTFPNWTNRVIQISGLLSVIIGFFLIFADDSHNDYYRYLWDGQASAMGLNVYETIPWETYEKSMNNEQWIMDNCGSALSIINLSRFSGDCQLSIEALFQKTGFKHYYTTYPPTMQLVLWASAELFPLSERGLKFIFYLFFLGSLLLIYQLYKNDKVLKKWIPVAFLLPLFLWEGIAAAHSEVLFLFFLFLTIFCFQKRWFFWVGVSLALLTWVKFFPAVLGLVFLVAVWREGKISSFRNLGDGNGMGKCMSSTLIGDPESIIAEQSKLTTCKSGSRINSFPNFTSKFSGMTGLGSFIFGGIVATIFLWLPFLSFNPEHFFDALTLYSSEWRMFPLVFDVFEEYFSMKVAQMIQFFGTLWVMLFVIWKKLKTDEQVFWTLLAYLLFSPVAFSWYFLWVLPLGIFVLVRKKWYIFLLGLLITPCIQHFFTVWDPAEQIFYYEENGLTGELKFLFWGGVIMTIVLEFFLSQYKKRKISSNC